ncbi:MAG: hypothetical protein R3E73_00955 [Porticoccaceae bacterium]|nr:hypothetical protein [Pseudomonadales bacterium]MCP5170685.1 hypothetical protein [Pseudomonadales bacterium]MCP5302074.1 hypothetical protein [Pseudomonadales bacterium]
MKQKDVPQNNSKTLGGQKKPLYVLGAEGEYVTELSSGWDVEEVVLKQALEQFLSCEQEAMQRAKEGLTAPLECHMYQRRMDISVLSQSTGFFKWQIRRHFKPARFSRLPEHKLARYADALDVSIETLKQLPLPSEQND